ncbi:MAG: hypothetical protein ACFCUE_15365 [Candidatus Bathyarchaeia archaeon]|jgi:hypothetical protein
MKQQNNRLKLAAAFILGTILCFGAFQVYGALQATSQLTLEEMYQNAIEDAMIAHPCEVSSNLTPIADSNTDLVWQGEDGNRTVLVVTLTKYASSYPVGAEVCTSWGETWVTVVPEIQNFFQNNVGVDCNLTLRTLQLLGLPPDCSNTCFVEMWVSPDALFRPTPDSEITDETAQLDFPSSTTAEYKDWFNSNIVYSYFPQRYPWTRLGYTYDWGNTDSHVGLSEFVLKQNSTVTVKAVYTIDTYLGE